MNLEKSRHGWEGISNGGEIYGSSQSGHDISSDMMKQLDEINALLDSIDIEDEDHFESFKQIEQEYLKTVKKLAEQKLKNEPTFEQLLNDTIRKFSSLGFNKSKDEIMIDIQIESLKNNLGNIFESSIANSPKSQVQSSSSIPRESAIQSAVDEYQKMRTTLTSESSDLTKKRSVNEELEREEKKIDELLKQTSNQTNEPKVVHLSNEETKTQNIWDDLNGIEINSEEYMDKFEKLYEIQVERLARLKADNSPEFESQLNFAVENILTRTDRIPNARDQLLYDINFYFSHSMSNITNNNNKEQLIYSIINHIYPNGVEYVPINDIKKRLESYSAEQLEEMIHEYEVQGQELNSGGMHR